MQVTQSEVLGSIDYTDVKRLRKPEIRNCMMHFGLKAKDGSSLIDGTYVDLAKPFCGLIESQFGKSYEEYQSCIEAELAELFDSISKYLDFDLAQ